jgi:hypothetical protein
MRVADPFVYDLPLCDLTGIFRESRSLPFQMQLKRRAVVGIQLP